MLNNRERSVSHWREDLKFNKPAGSKEKEIEQRIIATLERIRTRPDAYVKKLVGDDGYRLRVGNYRVIVDLDKEKLIILVLRIGHRKNVYD